MSVGVGRERSGRADGGGEATASGAVGVSSAFDEVVAPTGVDADAPTSEADDVGLLAAAPPADAAAQSSSAAALRARGS